MLLIPPFDIEYLEENHAASGWMLQLANAAHACLIESLCADDAPFGHECRHRRGDSQRKSSY
jgi:hypothetical protein